MDTILVVEDSRAMQRTLQRLFESDSLRVQIAPDGPSGLKCFHDRLPSAVVLDLKLPGMPGKDLCREFKALAASVPIVVLSANSDIDDKVLLLELGADDYVTKPFSSRELVARMRAVLRRRGEPEEPATSVLESGPVRMDVERHVVTVRGGQVQLPLKEFELLEVLLRNSGRVLTRMQLIDRVWGADYVGDTKTLDVHVKRLRAKVETDPSSPGHIVTVRGLGYKFEPAA